MSDLISRQAVLELPRNITRNFFGEIVEESIDIKRIEALPTAQPERKKGKWVLIGSRLESRPYACSKCNYAFQVDTVMGKTAWNYCPNCGAKMDEEEPEITEEDWHRDEWRDEWDERSEDG